MILDIIKLKVKVDLILLRQLRYLKGYLCKVYKRMMKMEKKKVFISGSRRFTSLPIEFEEVIVSLVKSGNYEFLVGDCSGTDLLVQQLLFGLHCKDVTVYCSGKVPRNFCGSVAWHMNCLGYSSNGMTARKFYELKDIQMSRDCDMGITLWDRVSRGTKRNIDRLYEMKKEVLIY